MRLPALGSLVFQKFSDSVVEQAYRHDQRRRQARFTRAMAIIAAAMFATYSLFNPLFISWDDVRGVALGHFSFIPLLIAYSWYVGQPGYMNSRFADLALFAGVQPGMYYAVGVFAATGASEWTFGTLLCYNVMVALAFACLAFAASVRRFLGLTLASVIYLLGALFLNGVTNSSIFYTGVFYFAYAILIFYLNWAIDDKARALFDARIKLDAEKKISDALLFNVLPQSIAVRLQSGEAVADAFPEVTIVFVDIVGFTKMSQAMDAGEVVTLLNAYFQKADAGCDLFGIEKVKTIGDAYMAVAGAIVPTPKPAKAVVDFACYLIGATQDISRQFGLDFKLHIGINTGPVVGGVIAGKKMLYDYWGDAINIASRLEGAAPPNGITVSQGTYDVTKSTCRYHPARRATLKGIGEVSVYDVDLSWET